jgi:hypothetical protein
MPTENRTRVEIYLPIRSDLSAYQVALNWLAEEFAFTRGGATMTTPLAGLFASPMQADIVHDAVRILFCDFEIDMANPGHRSEIIDYLESAKAFLVEALEEEEIWMIYYPVFRIIS